MSKSRAARCVERWCTSDAAWRGSSPSRAPAPSKRHSRVIRGHQWSSAVISDHQRGTQGSSEVISGHQRSSVIIKEALQGSSEVISGHQWSSVVISRGRIHTVVMPNHQRSSVVIRGHQQGSDPYGGDAKTAGHERREGGLAGARGATKEKDDAPAVISGHQRSSVVISGHRRSSVVISGNA